MSYDYISFESYYKHGETLTKVHNSFYDFFIKTLHGNIISFLMKILENEEIKKEDEEEGYIVEENEEEKEKSRINKEYYNKYKDLYIRDSYKRSNSDTQLEYFKILTEKIEPNEEKCFQEIIVMNELIQYSEWSIRSIIKVKKDSYSSYTI